MNLEILVQICELLAMIPYFMVEYTTGKFAGKAFKACAEQGGLLEKEPWNSYQQLTTNAEYCILELWKFNLG
jgi:hypothetical protein